MKVKNILASRFLEKSRYVAAQSVLPVIGNVGRICTFSRALGGTKGSSNFENCAKCLISTVEAPKTAIQPHPA
jgi:hypothetical protein